MASSKQIKLIVSDLDGTLLDSQKQISAKTRDAISRARENQIGFSVCTGRIQPMVQYYLKTLQIGLPVISANGAVIWDPLKEQVLWGQAIDETELLELMRFCQKADLDYCALTMTASYFSRDNIRRQRFEQYNQIAAAQGFTPMELQDFDEGFHCLQGQPVYKALVYEREPGQLAAAEAFLQTLPQTGYTSSEERLLDIGHKEIGKGAGLRKLAELLNIPLEQICAVGDYENDMPMLNAAGLSVAMENGCREIKAAADYITKSNDEHGVAWMIEQYLNGSLGK